MLQYDLIFFNVFDGVIICIWILWIHALFEVKKRRIFCPVWCGWSIYQLLVCIGVRPPPPKNCHRYDTKQSAGKVLVMLDLWGMWSNPSLPLLQGYSRVLSMGQIEQNWLLMLNWIVCNKNCFKISSSVNKKIAILILNWIVWNFYRNDLIRC